MKKFLFVFLISFFSLTVISCSDDDEESTTDNSTTDTSTTDTSTTDTTVESCTTDDTTTTTDNTTQMGGSRQGVELSLCTAVTTVAGTGSTGSANGTGTSASFDYPTGITTDGTNLYVSDYGNQLIRKIVISTGVVTTLAGTGSRGSANGTGTSASFNYPRGITTDGTNLYLGDSSNHLIRKIE
jgi:hypothetical protein